MASPVQPSSASSVSKPSVSPSPDWTVQVVDTIDSVVGSIRDKTTVPAETVARALVFGILVVAMVTSGLVLGTIGAIRLLDNWLRIWAVYAIIGGLFTVLGAFLWRKRRPSARK